MSLYVRLMTNFFTHRKTIRLRALLGDDALWLPPRLWTYAAEHQPDGNFESFTAQELAVTLGYTKDASSMLQAMLQAGFMDSDPLRIHDWKEHNGYHQGFAERARKAAHARWHKSSPRTPLVQKKGHVQERKGKETSIASSMLVASRSRFTPPKKDEAIFHGIKIGLPESEVEKFLNYYSANGWKVGRNGMKSWTHAMAYWKTNWESNGRHSKPERRKITDEDHRKGF